MSVASINVGFQVNVKELSEKLNQAATELENHKKKFQEVGNSIGQAGMYIGRYVDQMAGTVVTTIGGVVSFIPEIISGFSKLNSFLVANPWIALATAIASAGTALYFYTKKGSEATQMQRMLNDVNATALKNTAKERVELDSLVNVAKDVNALKGDRLKAIKKLNEISPKYLGDISLETINTKKATQAIGDYVDALNSKAREQALMAKKTELFQKQMELEMKSFDTGAIGQGVSDKIWGMFGVETTDPIIRTREELDKYIESLGIAGGKAEMMKKAYEPFFAQKEKEVALTEKQIKALDEYVAIERGRDDASVSSSNSTIKYYEEQISYFQKLQKEAALNSDMYRLYQNEIDKYRVKIASIDGGPKVKNSTKEQEKIKIDTVNFYEAQISSLKKYQNEEALTVEQFNQAADKIKVIQQKIDEITGARREVSSISLDISPVEGSIASLERLRNVLIRQMDTIKSWGGEFSLQYDVLKNKLQDIEFQIKVKTDEAGVSLSKFDESYNSFIARRDEASKASTKMLEEQSNANARMTEALGNSLLTMGNSLMSGLAGGEDAMKQFTIVMLQEIIKIIAMSQASAQANMIENATISAKSTGIGALFATPGFIALGLGMVASAFAGIQKFADGGVVFGPTLGLMGEYAGASNNPEVIAPLNKLKEMIAPVNSEGPIIIGGNIKVRGKDLEIVLGRQNDRNNRVR